MKQRLRELLRRRHYVLPLAVLMTLATQIGCPPMRPALVRQRVIRLDKPVAVQPDYVVAEVKDAADKKVWPALYYAFQVEGDRELQVYPGKSPFVLMIDKTTGRVERVGQSLDPLRAHDPPVLMGWGRGDDLHLRDSRHLRIRPPVVLEVGRSGEVRRFDKTHGWGQWVPASQQDQLLQDHGPGSKEGTGGK